MPQSSLSKIQHHHMVVLILAQASGGEMEVLQKLFQYFLLDKLYHSPKHQKEKWTESEVEKLPKPGGLGQVERAGPVAYTEVSSWLELGFCSSEKGWHAELLFVFMMLSHKHPLGTCILIQAVVFILGINQ